MKRMVFILCTMLFINTIACAQWLTSGSDIYNSYSGNVGIGTASPTRKLDILSGTGITPLAAVGPNGYMLIDNVGSGQSFYQANTMHQFQGTSNTPILTMLGSGNVGIGTTSPGTTLEVAGVIASKYSDADAVKARLWNTQTGNSLATYSTGTNAFSIPGWANAGVIEHDNNLVLDAYYGGIALQIQRNPGINLLSNGNVGIGIISPTEKLTVMGVANASTYTPTNMAVNNAQANIYEPNNSVNKSTALFKFTAFDNIGVIGTVYNGTQTGNLIFGINNGSTTVAEAMRINNVGNVAIGTTDPKGYKLAVAGDAIAESMTVDLQANWPDYVFKKNYSLPPLSELKKYIDENEHLPGVPTAGQVSKNGINLGAMNALLMKKVEELTLYLIEKDKQDKARQQEIDELKKQVAALVKAAQKDK